MIIIWFQSLYVLQVEEIHILVQEKICFILQWSVHTHETSQRQSWFLCSNWVNPPFHPLLLLFFYTTALDLTQCVHRIESRHLGQKQLMPWHCLLPFPSLSVGGESNTWVLCSSIKMLFFDIPNQNYHGITNLKYFLVKKPLSGFVF